MSIIRKTPIVLFLVLVLVLSSCTGGQKATQAPKAAQNQDAQYTQIAQTLVAELTAKAPAVAAPTQAPAQAQPAQPEAAQPTLPPTSTPLPTNTPIPTDTPLPTNTPLPTDTPTATFTWTPTMPAEPLFKLAFQDDFNGGGFWPTNNLEDVNFHYNDGGYVISSNVIGDIVFAVRQQREMDFSDVRVEVLASRRKGTLYDGYYGITCRFADGSNYYFFIVGADGSYGIGKKNWNMWTWLTEGKNTDVIYTGNKANLLRADCIDHTLSLWVNGVLLAEVEDKDFSAGYVGLLVGTRKEAPYEAIFDDFMAFIPQP